MRTLTAFLMSVGAVSVACGPAPSRPTEAAMSLAAEAVARPQAAPAWVTANWEQLVGTWVADNGAFMSETETMDAYGIEWSWGLEKKSLRGRLYGIKGGKEIATFWEFREFWHPGEGRLIATQYGTDGTYGVGPHDQDADGSTMMLQTFYNPTAGTITTTGHRARLEGDVHTTTSFNVDETGEWTERRTYIWRRQPR